MKDSQSDILTFWFEETKPQQWFQKNEDFDQSIRDRFSRDLDLAQAGIFDSWKNSAEGCLALCILLDQFPRNMFRNSARAFATDGQALEVAEHAVAKHYDSLLSPQKRRFLYLPFEHSEDLENQKKSLTFFAAMKGEDPMGYDYALRHLSVIEKFGRFPHRNVVLGRVSTPEEEAYLATPGAGF